MPQQLIDFWTAVAAMYGWTPVYVVSGLWDVRLVWRHPLLGEVSL
jgi:hypothetical protein